MNLLMVDIDGTLTETLSGEPFKKHPRDCKIIQGADKAIAHYKKAGWNIFGISNQGGVEAGFKTIESAAEEMNYTLYLFPELSAIYFCPDMKGERLISIWKETSIATDVSKFTPELIGLYRKPNAGMLNYIMNTMEEEGEGEELQRIWYVGDRPEDSKAAINAGVNFCHASWWREHFLGFKKSDYTKELSSFLNA
jgi:D-glycero-D-manno-heptose 1,7-bisphosphate phosphatase